MFPIRDPRGRVIAFCGRILGAGEPKYLNSPDTPLFDKGRTLFNFDRPRRRAATAKRVIVVEGQMDAIALDQAGIGEAVAPLGTALTEAQAGPALAAVAGPDPLLRRRRGRAEGGGPRRAARPSPCRPRPLAGLRHPARRPGSRRSHPRRRPRGAGGVARTARAAGRPPLAPRAATPSRSPRPSSARACAAACSTMSRRSPTPTPATSIAPSCSSASTR